ncbi:MAG: transposase [Planctomycetaceae bacterium]
MRQIPRKQRGDARVKLAERHQVEMRCLSLDQMIREDALVRTVVAFAETVDLSELYEAMQATKHTTGRSNIDPRILFSLWLFATLEGINSARRIDQLATRDVAYMWICGGVSVNYHTIADFRSHNAELLERCLTDSITTLHREDLVRLETLAQDGMRVRASAGSGSFRRKKSLEEAKKTAQEFYDKVCGQDDNQDDDDSPGPGSKAARKRAAREKLELIEAASEELEKMQEAYEKRNARMCEKHHRSEPRVSTTDPESRRMKMADKGTRPAYNAQFSSDANTLVIVAADVTNVGSDAGLMQPMYDSVCQTFGAVPSKYLADGGFSKKGRRGSS